MIKSNVSNRDFNKILVDSRSSVDILFKSTLYDIGIGNLMFEHINTSLKRFGGGRLMILRVVKLLVTKGLRPFEKIMMLEFVIIKESNIYKMIFRMLFMRIN